MSLLERETAREFKSGLMDHSMRDTGRMIRQMAEEDSSMQMVMYTKVSGKMTRLTALESIFTQMVPSMKASGRKINSMVLVRRPGLMVHVTRVITLKAKRTDKESSNGLMDPLIKVSSWTTTSTEEVCTFGQTTEDTKASG